MAETRKCGWCQKPLKTENPEAIYCVDKSTCRVQAHFARTYGGKVIEVPVARKTPRRRKGQRRRAHVDYTEEQYNALRAVQRPEESFAEVVRRMSLIGLSRVAK